MAAFGTRGNHASVVFDNKMWMLGGWNEQIILKMMYGGRLME